MPVRHARSDTRGRPPLAPSWWTRQERFDKIPQRIGKHRDRHTRSHYLADEDQVSEVLLHALLETKDWRCRPDLNRGMEVCRLSDVARVYRKPIRVDVRQRHSGQFRKGPIESVRLSRTTNESVRGQRLVTATHPVGIRGKDLASRF